MLLVVRKFIFRLFLIYFSVIDYILSLIFGKIYKRLINRIYKLYINGIKLISIQTSYENQLNDTLLRLERTEDKLIALQNQMVCFQRQLQQIQYNTSITSIGSTHTTVPSVPKMSTFGPLSGLSANTSKMIGEKRSHESGLSSHILWHLLNSSHSEHSTSNAMNATNRRHRNISATDGQCHSTSDSSGQ